MANTRVCILGNNACAWKIADTLSEAGTEVILATRDTSPLPQRLCRVTGSPAQEVLCGARLAACRGGIGQFDLTFSRNGTDIRRTVAAVVIAESDERRPNHALYGLTPGAGVVPLSGLPEDGNLPPTNGSPLKHAAFLNGLVAESHPLIAGEIMRAALRLQTEHQVQCTILTGNLKVAGDGLEALSREARSAGVLFFKFTTSTPTIRQKPGGRVQLAFIDELTGREFALAPDLVVLDETVAPSAYAVQLGRILALESDPAGFVQGDNVHRLTALTNRRGIVVAGPSRGIGLDPAVEASNAVIEALATAASAGDKTSQSAAIEPGRCIRCLTCLRVCPYRAVLLDTRPSIQPAACERCGICAAECPREAIRIPGLERSEMQALITSARGPEPKALPYVVAFCCRRSAGVATKAAVAAGKSWDAVVNVIEVPCAGSLAPEFLLSAFSLGADGVLVLTCHEDNCHSRQGNRFARTRTDQACAFLRQCGADPTRLVFKTLAANMETELDTILSELCATLHAQHG
ncbi:MAG TPA: hydrogenase iron-sulfur subunit [Desulfobacterales bacterium]|nr:hydrogenase iron-sulfur subunit [Desulfobacterales bacterium]